MVHILHDAERRPLPLLSVQRSAIQSDLSSLFPDQAAQAPGEGGLAHAIGSGDSHHFPRAGRKGQVLKHSGFLSVGAGQALYGQAFFHTGWRHRGQGTGRRYQGTQAQCLPFPVGQGEELLPGEGALQHPVPQVECPVDQVGEKV